jgi:hypothetical protein
MFPGNPSRLQGKIDAPALLKATPVFFTCINQVGARFIKLVFGI